MANERAVGSVERRPSSGASASPTFDRTTLLVLSGLLVGLGLQNAVATRLGPYSVAAGCAGLLGYLALSHLARRQERSRSLLEAERKLLRLHARLDRHLPQLRPNRRALRDRRQQDEMLLQYMPVVQAGHRRRDVRTDRRG